MGDLNIQTRTHKNVPVTYIDGDSNKPAIFYHHGLYGTRDGDQAKSMPHNKKLRLPPHPY